MGVLVRTLFTLLAAVSAATAIAQPVVWERTPTVLQNTLPPEQVASDGAGGVYVARLGGFGSVTRIDASGVELWTARILFVPYCVQCRLDLHGLTANAEAAFVIVRAHFIKFGPCGVFCAISFVTRFSAADGSLSSPFGLSVQQ